MTTRLVKSLVALAITLLTLAGAASACPMCKDSITDTAVAAQQRGGNEAVNATIHTGFTYSIYLLLIGVFCVMAMMIGIITRGIRASDAAMRAGEAAKRKT